MIILGDFGGVWDGSSEEWKQLDWLNEKPFTTLFATGNHENYQMLQELPEEDWHGGKVQRVRPNILHLMRGQLYDIEGHTFFTMGGAASHDVEDGILDPDAPDFRVRCARLISEGKRRFRIIGKSWWPEELPSDEEYTAALDTLERADWKADYVLTHCAPTSIVRQMSRHSRTCSRIFWSCSTTGWSSAAGCSDTTMTTARSIQSTSYCGSRSYS